MIQVQDVSKSFWNNIDLARKKAIKRLICAASHSSGDASQQKHVLKNVSFEVREEDRVLLLGPSGSGKTTLAECLSGIKIFDSGKFETGLFKTSLIRQKIGIQRPTLTLSQYIRALCAFLSPTRRQSLNPQDFQDWILWLCDAQEIGEKKVKDIPVSEISKIEEAVQLSLADDFLIIDSSQSRNFPELLVLLIKAFPTLWMHSKIPNEDTVALFNRCLILIDGKLIFDGPVIDGIALYRAYLDFQSNSSWLDQKPAFKLFLDYLEKGKVMTAADMSLLARRGNGVVRFVDLRIGNSESGVVSCGEPIVFELEYLALSELQNSDQAKLVFVIEDQNHNRLFSAPSHVMNYQFDQLGKKGLFTVQFDRLPLVPGQYFIVCSLHVNGKISDKLNGEYKLEVAPGDFYGTGQLPDPAWGQVLVDFKWQHRKLEDWNS